MFETADGSDLDLDFPPVSSIGTLSLLVVESEDVFFPFNSGIRDAGSIALEPFQISKCRCGPVDLPVLPERPIYLPGPTDCPFDTPIVDRCMYLLSYPFP